MRAPLTPRWLTLVAAVAIVVAIGGPAAVGQKSGPQNALQGFSQNRSEPVKIKAAALEVREKEKLATFSGDVHVVQGDTEMRCKSLVVYYDEENSAGKTSNLKAADPGPAGSKQIRRIEAKGGVTVTQKDQNAVGDTGIFDMRANTVTLVGNVIVTRGQDVLRGPRLVVDLGNGVSKMDGQGQVEGLFQARQRTPEKK